MIPVCRSRSESFSLPAVCLFCSIVNVTERPSNHPRTFWVLAGLDLLGKRVDLYCIKWQNQTPLLCIFLQNHYSTERRKDSLYSKAAATSHLEPFWRHIAWMYALHHPISYWLTPHMATGREIYNFTPVTGLFEAEGVLRLFDAESKFLGRLTRGKSLSESEPLSTASPEPLSMAPLSPVLTESLSTTSSLPPC